VSSRRTLILIAALVVGALAAVVVWNYVNGADDRAQGNAAQVDVFVVKRDIPRGTNGASAIDDGFIQKDQIPQRFRPGTAVTDEETIRTFQAVTDLAANSVLVQGMFVSPQDASFSNAELLKDNRVAVTISVDDVHGVAGLIVPGDFVNVMVMPRDDFCAAPTQDPGSAKPPTPPTLFDLKTAPVQSQYVCRPARMLYEKVQVLFVDKTTVTQPGQTPTTTDTGEPAQPAVQTIRTGLITLAVPAAGAQYVASINADQLYLTLVAPDYNPQALGQIDSSHITTLPGEDPAQQTPYGPTGLSGD
jgi:Flp pilus assembly protein CpaB